MKTRQKISVSTPLKERQYEERGGWACYISSATFKGKDGDKALVRPSTACILNMVYTYLINTYIHASSISTYSNRKAFLSLPKKVRGTAIVNYQMPKETTPKVHNFLSQQHSRVARHLQWKRALPIITPMLIGVGLVLNAVIPAHQQTVSWWPLQSMPGRHRFVAVNTGSELGIQRREKKIWWMRCSPSSHTFY